MRPLVYDEAKALIEAAGGDRESVIQALVATTKSAYAEGFEKGFEEGFEKGFEEGYNEGRRAD